MKIPLALSPCPNDTYLFAGWIGGHVGRELLCEPYFADIEELNRMAQESRFPLTKLSFSTYAKLADYKLLPIGAALGFGVGPKLIGLKPTSLDQIPKLKIAIPGIETTAHFLLDHFFPGVACKRISLYSEIEELILKGEVDLGLVIHETRFTFQKKGLFEVADLGTLWEERYQLPLPLGGLALRVDFEEEREMIVSILQDSLSFAKTHFETIFPLIKNKAQEKSREVIQKHIDLYVNEETRMLSEKGQRAIDKFLSIVRV